MSNDAMRIWSAKSRLWETLQNNQFSFFIKYITRGERKRGGRESLRIKRDLRDTSAFRKVRGLTGLPDFNKITSKLYNLTLYND